MWCRTHPSDHSAGVCARCLRERLSALTAAAAEHNAEPSPAILSSRSDFANASDDARKRRAVKSFLFYLIWGKSTPEKTESGAIFVKSSASNSRFFALIIKQLKKNKKKSPSISPTAEDVTRGRSTKPRVQPLIGRGLSPAEEDERRIITPSALRKKARRQQNPNSLSRYVVCLSPMLRPSIGIRRNHYPMLRPSSGIHRNRDPWGTKFSGSFQGTINRKWSGVGVAVTDVSSAIRLNQSRKHVDLGLAWAAWAAW